MNIEINTTIELTTIPAIKLSPITIYRVTNPTPI